MIDTKRKLNPSLSARFHNPNHLNRTLIVLDGLICSVFVSSSFL